MRDEGIPRGWKRINDVCIGVPEGKGYAYTVARTGSAPDYRWEACSRGRLLGVRLMTMQEAIGLCRADFKAIKEAA